MNLWRLRTSNSVRQDSPYVQLDSWAPALASLAVYWETMKSEIWLPEVKEDADLLGSLTSSVFQNRTQIELVSWSRYNQITRCTKSKGHFIHLYVLHESHDFECNQMFHLRIWFFRSSSLQWPNFASMFAINAIPMFSNIRTYSGGRIWVCLIRPYLANYLNRSAHFLISLCQGH